MQQKPLENRRQIANLLRITCVLHVLVLTSGCYDRPSTIDIIPERPFQGVKLRVAVSDPSDVSLIKDVAKSWTIRNKSSIEISEIPNDPLADLALIRPCELPVLAESDKLLEIPSELLSATNPYRFDDIFIAQTSQICTWKTKNVALPVLGEGLLFIYRTDVWNGKNGQAGPPPKTWQDVLAKAMTAPKKALATWPASDESKEALFQSLAASLDRPAIKRLPGGAMVRDEFFSFHFDTANGNSRLGGHSFVEAGKLMASLTPLMTPGTDPADSFNKHGASMGFVSLKELSRIEPAILSKIGILPLPGTNVTINSTGERVPVPGGNVNRVALIGCGGRLGVVSKKCERPDAAWDFWIDIGMPDQQSLDLIGAGKWGAGPFRSSHLDTRARSRWLAYGLGSAETDQLTSSLRENLGIGTQNFRTCIRTPNESEFRQVLRTSLRSIIDGTTPAEKAIADANAEWNSIIAKLPPGQWKIWLRASLGL